MGLSNDLVSQFVKVTKDTDEKKRNTTVYGTLVKVGNTTGVMLDGSEVITPVSTLADYTEGDRVMVNIDNHNATIIGNITSPSARVDDVINMGYRIEANEAEINNLNANRITTDYLKANYAEIGVLDAAKARITDLEVRSANIEELKADRAEIDELDAKYASIDELDAVKANITSLDSKYVNIDYTNIDETSIKKFYAKFGMMEDVTISNGTVTGKLVGVTINGDLIQAGTLVADKLVIRTEDGLLYKLNAEALGEAGLAEIEDLETLKNGLHGAIINDKTIVAEKIKVDDLVAFGATIGGFKIESDSIHSVVKESVNNTTRGIYMDNDGQLNVGDAFNFIKFYRDGNYKQLTVEPLNWSTTYRSYFSKIDDEYVRLSYDTAPTFEAGKYYEAFYKLAVSADEVMFGSSRKNLQTALDEVANSSISGVDVEYYKSTSATELSGGSWDTTSPTWENGTYIWSRTKTTSADNTVSYSDPVCITGNTGAAGTPGKDGKDGVDGTPGTDGTNGRSVGSIINYYLVSDQDSGITNIDRRWDTEIPTMTSTDKYLWNYEEISDTTGSLITRTDPCIIGVYGDTGAAGKDGTNGKDGKDGADGTNGTDGAPGKDGKGISSITEHYQVTSTTTTPASWVSTVPTLTSTNKYLWNYETITYTDGTSTDSKKRIIGVYGDTGAAGKNGVDGAPGEQGIGVSSIIEQYYLSTSEVEPTGGDWANEQPTWSSGSYIWTRSFITWSDDTTSTTAPVLAQAINDANANADQASSDADKANAAADDARQVANSAYSEISKLNDAIKNLVVGKDGSTLMTQTADGWQFNFGNFKDTIDDIGKKTAYVHIDETDTGNPKIELGKADNKAKLTLTNEDIQFVVGSEVPTKVTNEGLDTDKIKVDNEIAMGNFVWKNRANGNLGLSWKGAGS